MQSIQSTGLGDDEKPTSNPRHADPAGLGDDERLVTSPKGAAYMLDIGVTHLYELLKPGEPGPDGKPTKAALESYKDGPNRKIMVASIRKYVADKLKQAKLEQADRKQAGTNKRKQANRKQAA